MLKNIFSDIFLLYKNFFFWFKIKFFAFILGIILGILIILPSTILSLFYAYYKKIDLENISLLALDFEKINDFGMVIFISINSILFFIGFLYSYIFLIKNYLTLIEKRKKIKIEIKEIIKDFFNKKYIIKFIGISFFNVIFFGILFLGILFFYKFLANTYEINGSLNLFTINGTIHKNIWYISIFSLILIFIIIFLIYKFIFSYSFLVDKDFGVFRSIEKSLKRTNFKKFIKVLLSIIIFLFPFLSIELIFKNTNINLEKEKSNIEGYLYLKNNITKQEKFKKEFEILDLKYFGTSDKDLKIRYQSATYIIYLINFLNFLFIYGVFSMIFTSIYKNIIKEKND